MDKQYSGNLRSEDESEEDLVRRDFGMKKLFYDYLDRISRGYEEISEEERDSLINDLEFIIKRHQLNLLLGIEDISQKYEFEKLKSINLFNRNIAKKIRENSDLTQRSLGDKLGLPQSCISKWESGFSTPRPYNKDDTLRKKSMSYLEWLNEQGYNPYGIDFESE